MADISTGQFLIGGALILVAITMCNRSPESPAALAAESTQSVAAPSACGVDRISVSINRLEFVDECRRSSCPVLKGAATVTNGCPAPVGIQLKMTALDGSGSPVSVRSGWPESTRNMPIGDTSVSLDQWVDYDPEIKSFRVEPVDVRAW